MSAVLPDLSVTISQRRWSCVLDPTLALSYYGLALVKRLRQVMEVWVVRELWNILDNTHFYLQDPASLLPNREAWQGTAGGPASGRQCPVRLGADPDGNGSGGTGGLLGRGQPERVLFA